MNRITQVVNILLIVSVIGSLIAGYFLFMGGEEDSTIPESLDSESLEIPDFSSDVPARVSDELSISSAEVVLLLEKIRSINLDDALFRSAAFQSLGNSTVELTPEAKGIGNPFDEL